MSPELAADWQQSGLAEAWLKAVAGLGWTAMTDIQAQVVPPALAGRDVLAVAPTGSGKTAAYLLPLLQRLTAGAGKSPQALILVPTRELATQVAETVTALTAGAGSKLRTLAVYGGVSLNPQMEKLRSGVQLLAATPGRLLDLLDKNAVKLDQVQSLVLDEADKMLDLGFQDELGRILGLLPARRANLLVSATLSNSLKNVAAAFLSDPVVVGVDGQPRAAEIIEQRVFKVEPHQKGVLLRHLVKTGDWKRVLVFVSSKRTADNLVGKLTKNGITALALHGDKSQSARASVLSDFKLGRLRVLVATDLAARGLDIVDLPHVVNYELPRSPEDYVHRIGRTGRAGKPGTAITLLTPAEFAHMRVIQKRMQTRLVWETVAGFELQEPAESVKPVPGPSAASRSGDPESAR